jgi:signal peptidase II
VDPVIRARRPLVLFYSVAATVLVLDIITKAIVYRTLPLHGPSIELVGSYVRLTYIHNAGAAFGLFQGNRYFFIGVSLLSSLVILLLAHNDRYRDRWMRLAFGLVLGGALGNLLDRIWLGVVIDFIDVGIGRHRWPFFNVADSGITVGVCLLAFRFIREPKSESVSPATPEGSP